MEALQRVWPVGLMDEGGGRRIPRGSHHLPSTKSGKRLSSLNSIYLTRAQRKLVLLYPSVSWLPQYNFRMKFLNADHTRYFSGPNVDLC